MHHYVFLQKVQEYEPPINTSSGGGGGDIVLKLKSFLTSYAHTTQTTSGAMTWSVTMKFDSTQLGTINLFYIVDGASPYPMFSQTLNNQNRFVSIGKTYVQNNLNITGQTALVKIIAIDTTSGVMISDTGRVCFERPKQSPLDTYWPGKVPRDSIIMKM